MIEGLKLLRLSEGFDPSTPLGEVWEATLLRAKVELEKERRSAMTLMRGMSVFVKGGEFTDMAKHLYPPTEMKRIEAERQAMEEELSAMRRLDMFRAIARRFDDAKRGC